jgi:hypothetical protein
MKTYQVAITETKRNIITVLADNLVGVQACLLAKGGTPIPGTESVETTTSIMEIVQPEEQ